MKWLIPVLIVASLAFVSEAQAGGFGRRSNVVVQAGGANVFVGGRSRRQQVVVQAQPFFVQRSFVQPVFVQPFAVQTFGVQSFHGGFGVQSFGVQSFNGGCQSFFVR